MTARGIAKEHVAKSHLMEKDANDIREFSEVERNRDHNRRLAAISASLSFHSEFLQRLTEMDFTVTNNDGVKEATWVQKSRATENTTEEQQAERCNDEVNGREMLSDAANLNKNIPLSQTGIQMSSLDSSLSSRHDGCSAPASPGTQTKHSKTKTNSPVLQFSKDDQSYAIINTTKRPPKKFNVQYSYEYNMDTLIFHAAGEFNVAKSINEKVLRVIPDNFNAMWNKVKLMVTTAVEPDDCIHDGAEEILDRLEEMASQNGKQMLIAKAEIAAMHAALQVSADSLIRSIQLYEEVLTELSLSNRNGFSDPIPENLVAFWKCSLVENYGNLTNANKAILATYGYTHGKVLSRIEVLVRAVDSSEHIEGKLKAQTWVNLANTFEHYRHNHPKERFQRDIYDDVSLADCFTKAREYDPGNPRILMRSGRELRQRARSEYDMKTAIKYFEMALNGDDIDSIRDILYHHIGLTYRSLWNHTEAPTFDNKLDAVYRFRSNDYHRCRVVKPPDSPFDFSLIPPPYKELPKNALWKIINPIARDPENDYLLKARENFEEANHFYYDKDLSNPLYLMEIARIHSSSRNIQKARQCLQEAEKLRESEAVDDDFIGASLYENLGLLEETELLMKRFSDPETETVKHLYRESIRFSAISKTKPIVAFYYLLRILYKQLERCVDRNLSEVDQMILQNEYFLLYMAIQEAEDGRDIVNLVATDDFRVALMWRLVEMFHQRNHPKDAAAALAYLTILAMTNKLTTEVKGIDLTSTEKQRILIKSAERVTRQRVEQPRFLPNTYRQLYELRCSSNEEDESYRSFRSEPLTELEKEKLDIAMKILQPHLDPAYIRRHERC